MNRAGDALEMTVAFVHAWERLGDWSGKAGIVIAAATIGYLVTAVLGWWR